MLLEYSSTFPCIVSVSYIRLSDTKRIFKKACLFLTTSDCSRSSALRNVTKQCSISIKCKYRDYINISTFFSVVNVSFRQNTFLCVCVFYLLTDLIVK